MIQSHFSCIDFHEIQEQELITADNLDLSLDLQENQVVTRGQKNSVRQQWTIEFFQDLQRDPFYQEISQVLGGRKKSTKRIRRKALSFTLDKDMLLWKKRRQNQSNLYVPFTRRERILRENHDQASHSSFFYTFKRITEKYYWDSIRKDIRNYISSCETCQTARKLNFKRPGRLQTFEIPHDLCQAGQWWTLDFMGPITIPNTQVRTNVLVDRLNRFCILAEIKKTNGQKFNRFVRLNFCKFRNSKTSRFR